MSTNESKGQNSRLGNVNPSAQLGGTTLFRMMNFELFVKNNKFVIYSGLVAITGCAGYLFYMRSQRKPDATDYVAIAEDGTESLQVKKSKWD